MSPLAFVLSTVVPAVVAGICFFLFSRSGWGRWILPAALMAAFGFGLTQLSGFPELRWPLVIQSFLLAFGVGAAALEMSLAHGRRPWHLPLGLLWVLLFAWALRDRLVESTVWAEENSWMMTVPVVLIMATLLSPSWLISVKASTWGTRSTLILTGVAASVVTLVSGSALLAQLLGVLVALQVAMVVSHLVFYRGKDLPPIGLKTVVALQALLLILIYFFVEPPRWPWMFVCASALLSALASPVQGSEKPLRGILRGGLMALPALLAAAFVAYQQVQEMSSSGY